MATKSTARSTTTGTRGRNQDRARVAGGQKHEVAYAAEKASASASEVKAAVKRVGNSRQKVERALKK